MHLTVHTSETGVDTRRVLCPLTMGRRFDWPPDDLDEIAPVDVIGCKELGFAQDRKLRLTLVRLLSQVFC